LGRLRTGQQLEEFYVKVILEPVSGNAKDNLERAKFGNRKVLAFRGSVTSARAKDTRIMVKSEINPKWDLPDSEKVKSLRGWIPAKVRTVFKVLSVSA